MNIEDNFCNYKIAKQLKELGFDEECITFYDNEKKLGFNGKYSTIKKGYKSSTVNNLWIKRYGKDFKCIAAPLYQQVLQWLIEKYNIHVSVSPVPFENGKFFEYSLTDNNKCLKQDGVFDTYNEALIKAILEALKLIKL